MRRVEFQWEDDYLIFFAIFVILGILYCTGNIYQFMVIQLFIKRP